MEVYTIQISNRHRLPADIRFIDTTVKTGDRRLSPVWSMVFGVKEFKRLMAEEGAVVEEVLKIDGVVSTDEFIRRYEKRMLESQKRFPDYWDSLLTENKIALGCYCNISRDKCPFCHRLLLKEIIIRLCNERGIPVVDGGEFTIVKVE